MKDNKNNYIPRIITFGLYDINYSITLNDEDIIKYDLDMDLINNINDLDFIVDNSELWERIEITSNNFTLNTILNIIKFSDEDIYTEFVTFGYPKINQKYKKLENMLDDLNSSHFIYLNKNNIISDGYSISFTINYGIINNKIELFTKEEELDIYINESKNDIDLNKEDINNKIQNEDEYSTYINLDNKDSIFNKVNLLCDKYEYFLMTINDSIKIEPYTDFLELLTYCKTKLFSNIIIHYTDISQEFTTDEQIMQLNRIYLLTDTYLINTNIATILFNAHNNSFNKENNEIININEYFINNISYKGKLCIYRPKVLYTIDDTFSLLKISEIENNGKSLNLNYTVRPYPQINRNNIEKVNKYKNILIENNLKYESIFYGGILSQFIFEKNKKIIEILYSSYLAGLQIICKLIQYDYENNPLPKDDNFYKIKLNKSHIDSFVKKYENEKKESKFILDCNTKESAMKNYVPLLDKDLYDYFKHNNVQKDLINKGFINEKGYVNYDPYYKKEMNKIKKIKNNDIKYKNKILDDINNKDKFINKKIILDSIEPTKIRLPIDSLNTNCKSNKKRITNKSCQHICNKREYKSSYLRELGKQAELAEEQKKRSMQLRRYEY